MRRLHFTLMAATALVSATVAAPANAIVVSGVTIFETESSCSGGTCNGYFNVENNTPFYITEFAVGNPNAGGAGSGYGWSASVNTSNSFGFGENSFVYTYVLPSPGALGPSFNDVGVTTDFTWTAFFPTSPDIVYGYDANGNPVSCTSTAGVACDPTPTGVPEPTSLALFAAGLLGLGFAGRRRRRRPTAVG